MILIIKYNGFYNYINQLRAQHKYNNNFTLLLKLIYILQKLAMITMAKHRIIEYNKLTVIMILSVTNNILGDS